MYLLVNPVDDKWTIGSDDIMGDSSTHIVKLKAFIPEPPTFSALNFICEIVTRQKP